jgi:hypothetical protein
VFDEDALRELFQANVFTPILLGSGGGLTGYGEKRFKK